METIIKNKNAKTKLEEIIFKINSSLLFNNDEKKAGIEYIHCQLGKSINQLKINDLTININDNNRRSYGEIYANYFNDVFEILIKNALININQDIIFDEAINNDKKYNHDISFNYQSKCFLLEIKTYNYSFQNVYNKMDIFLNNETLNQNINIIMIFHDKIGIINMNTIKKIKNDVNNYRKKYTINKQDILTFDTIELFFNYLINPNPVQGLKIA